MRDRDLYSKILDIQSPWAVVDVILDAAKREVRVQVEVAPSGKLTCPTCGAPSPRYDSKRRQWRHLDTCQYRTILDAEVPRIECPEHGPLQVRVPWAEPGSRFTAMFEALVIDWLKEASISAVADMTGLTWHEVDGVMKRAVRRGLDRRKAYSPARIGVDETSFQKRHEYVTVVSDQALQIVLYVADDRKTTSLDGFYSNLTPEQLLGIEVVAMDMCAAFISSTHKNVPNADAKICFDRFHVAQLLNHAVDEVRRKEHAKLLAEGDATLSQSRFAWLTKPENLKPVLAAALEVLKSMALKTSRAWAIKEMASKLWRYANRTSARKAWKRWMSWAVRSRIEPIKKAARTIRKHIEGILNAVVLMATNVGAESINAKIQKVKNRACGFRNRQRFKDAIMFHLGGLDLYPAHCGSTHTKA